MITTTTTKITTATTLRCLHYTTTTATTALHHDTSSSCGWGDHCNHCNHFKKHNFNHLSVHQWIRSAIRDSQQPTSPIGFPFLGLPPPPCAVLLVLLSLSMCIHYYMYLFCNARIIPGRLVHKIVQPNSWTTPWTSVDKPGRSMPRLLRWGGTKWDLQNIKLLSSRPPSPSPSFRFFDTQQQWELRAKPSAGCCALRFTVRMFMNIRGIGQIWTVKLGYRMYIL